MLDFSNGSQEINIRMYCSIKLVVDLLQKHEGKVEDA
jgi:hypothetical protein